MKKIWLLHINILMLIVFACQSIQPITDQSMLKPGDEINGMVITTGIARTPPLWAFCSPALEYDHTTTAICDAPPLPKLAIGHVFGIADQVLQSLNWSELTWELVLDGHPVDLSAFGISNYVVPDLAPRPLPIREIFWQRKAWDIVLINPTPGEHKLHGMALNEAATYKWVVTFTIEGSVEP